MVPNHIMQLISRTASARNDTGGSIAVRLMSKAKSCTPSSL